jgi:hypothetical protein
MRKVRGDIDFKNDTARDATSVVGGSDDASTKSQTFIHRRRPMLTAVTAWNRSRRLQRPTRANGGSGRHELSRFVLMTSAIFALGLGCAQAGPCTTDIEKIEKVLNERNSPFGPTGRQSVGAQMGRQPTPSSMARAEQKAGSHYQAALTRAQALDNQNNPACKKAVKKLKALVGMQ